MIGRISKSRADVYAERYFGWGGEHAYMVAAFWLMISKLDAAYRRWMHSEFKRASRKQ